MNLADLLLPKQCILCSRVGFDICNQCLTKIPKALPTCLICNKLSNYGLIHKECLDIEKEICWIKGWNPLEKDLTAFESKKENNLFSIHIFLLRDLSERFEILKKAFRIQTITNNLLDKDLSKKLHSNLHSETLCFVGEKIEDKENLTTRIKKTSIKNILILTIF